MKEPRKKHHIIRRVIPAKEHTLMAATLKKNTMRGLNKIKSFGIVKIAKT
jgi:hypothetical protein